MADSVLVQPNKSTPVTTELIECAQFIALSIAEVIHASTANDGQCVNSDCKCRANGLN